MAESGEVGAEASGQASARGSASSKKRRAVELLDTVARRRDDGEREFHGGAGAAASAMARESEGERQGRMDVSTGFGARRGGHTGQQGGEGRKQGSGQLRGARRSRRRAPACLPGKGK